MTARARPYGVHSEVGTLRKVLVCAPGLAHRRLTPSNCDDLLFDDVLWVQNAQRDHFDFIAKMRDRVVEVVELHNLLSETMDIPEARPEHDHELTAAQGRHRSHHHRRGRVGTWPRRRPLHDLPPHPHPVDFA